MGDALADVLTLDAVRGMAGSRSFHRGEEYYESDAVASLVEDKGVVAAKVIGTREYRIRLWAAGGKLHYSCTCPLGVDGVFCKHCVATGLAWLAQGKAEQEPAREHGERGRARKKPKPTVTMEDVRAYLAKQDTASLVEMVMDQAVENDRLRERLLMKVAAASAKGLDLETFCAAIDSAVHPGEYVDYNGMYDYAAGIEEVVDSIRELLKDGHAEAVIELTEHALRAVEESMGTVDDSDGHMGSILEDLQELHHAACVQAKPDPEALARSLFEWEVSGSWDTFYGAAATYADVLGDKGLAVYRQLAEAEWAKVRALKSGDKDPEQYGRRRRTTHIMETLAEQAGDIEALVAIKAKDLSQPHAFLAIAQAYKEAKERDKALEWAERGMKTFATNPDPRLRAFLVEEYHQRKRHDEAMALVWDSFTQGPDLPTYQALSDHAKRVKQWPAWREKALACIRDDIAKRKQKEGARRPSPWEQPADHSPLVRIFLWEKDAGPAWTEAKAGGCSEDLWLDVARARQDEHPDDAIPIYQRHVETCVRGANNDAYRAAISYLRTVRALMKCAGREAEFAPYAAGLRAAHKPKRNFVKLLDHAQW